MFVKPTMQLGGIIPKFLPLPCGTVKAFVGKMIFAHVPLNHDDGGLLPRGGVLPYMSYIGICSCEGYGFQAVYSSIGYINHSVWV